MARYQLRNNNNNNNNIWLDKKIVLKKIRLSETTLSTNASSVYICGSSEQGMEYPMLSSAKNEKAD